MYDEQDKPIRSFDDIDSEVRGQKPAPVPKLAKPVRSFDDIDNEVRGQSSAPSLASDKNARQSPVGYYDTPSVNDPNSPVGGPMSWQGTDTDASGRETGAGMVIHKPAGVAPRPRQIDLRSRQAAQMARNINEQRNEATRLFQQADRTPMERTGGAFDNRQQLRAQAEGKIEQANMLAKNAQRDFGDHLEVGFGKDADPNSKRQWAYAKPKAPKAMEEADAMAIRSRDVERPADPRVQRQVLDQRTSPGPRFQRVDRSNDPDANWVQDKVSRFGRAAVGTIPGAISGTAKLADAMYGGVKRLTGNRLPTDGWSADWSPVVSPPMESAQKGIEESLPIDPSRNEDFSSKIASGLGSAAGFGKIGGAARAIGLPFKTAIGAAGVGLGADEIANEMKQAGFHRELDPARYDRAVMMGGATGLTELVGLGKTLERFGLKRAVLQRGVEVLENSGQEAFQQWMGNVNAANVGAYDLNREQGKGVLEAAILGGIVSGGVQAADLGMQAAQPATIPQQIADRPLVNQNNAIRAERAPMPGIRPTVPGPTNIIPITPRATKDFALKYDNGVFDIVEHRPLEQVGPQNIKALVDMLQGFQTKPGVPPEMAHAAGVALQNLNQRLSTRTAAAAPSATPASAIDPTVTSTPKSTNEPTDPATIAAESSSALFPDAQPVVSGGIPDRSAFPPGDMGDLAHLLASREAAKKPSVSKDSPELAMNKAFANASVLIEKGDEVSRARGVSNLKRMLNSVIDSPEYAAELGLPDDAPKPYSAARMAIEERLQPVPVQAEIAPAVANAPTAELPAPQNNTGQRLIEQTRQKADQAITEGRFAEAISELKAHQQALKDAKTAARKSPGLRTQLERQIGQAGNRIGEVRRMDREARKQANAPTAGLPAQKPTQVGKTPLAPQVETAPLLRPEAVQNPEGGIPQMPEQTFTGRMDAGIRRDETAQGKAKPAKRIIDRIKELGGISAQNYKGELQSLKDARRVGIMRNRPTSSPDILARQLAEDGYDVDPDNLDTLWAAIDRDVSGQERVMNTGEIGRRLEAEEAEHYAQQEVSANYDEIAADVDSDTAPLRQPAKSFDEIDAEVRAEFEPDTGALRRSIAASEERGHVAPTPGIGLVSMSPYADMVARNSEAVDRLYETGPATPEGRQIIGDLRKFAQQNGIENRHLGNLINAVKNYQMDTDFWKERGLDLSTVQQSLESLDADMDSTREQIASLPDNVRTEVEREVAALDALFDDADAVNLLERAANGEDNAINEFKRKADEYGLSGETVADLVEARRPTQSANQGRSRQDAQSQSPARNTPTRTEPRSPTEDEFDLLIRNPATIPTDEFDDHVKAIEKLRNDNIRGIVKLSRDDKRALIQQSRNTNEERKFRVRRKEMPAKFESRVIPVGKAELGKAVSQPTRTEPSPVVKESLTTPPVGEARRQAWQITRDEMIAEVARKYEAKIAEAETKLAEIEAEARKRPIQGNLTRRKDRSDLRQAADFARKHGSRSAMYSAQRVDAKEAIARFETEEGKAKAYAFHKGEVEKAIAEGKPVPAEVLADYPELQKKPESAPIKDGDTVTWQRGDKTESGKVTKVNGDFITAAPEDGEPITRHKSKFASAPKVNSLVLDETESLRQEWGILKKFDAADIQGAIDNSRVQTSVDPANKRAGIIYVNSNAKTVIDKIWSSNGGAEFSAAVALDTPALEAVEEVLRHEASFLEGGDAKQVNALADAFSSMVSHKYDGAGLINVDLAEQGFLDLARNHELFHVWQYGQSQPNDVTRTPMNVEWASKVNGYEKVREILVEKGYPDDQEDIVREFAAYAATNDLARLGISEHEAETVATDFLYEYFTQISKQYGAEHLERIGRVSIPARAVAERVSNETRSTQTVRETTSESRRGQQAASSPSRTAVSSIRLSGREETGRRTGGEAGDTAETAPNQKRSSFGELANEPTGEVLGTGLGGLQRLIGRKPKTETPEAVSKDWDVADFIGKISKHILPRQAKDGTVKPAALKLTDGQAKEVTNGIKRMIAGANNEDFAEIFKAREDVRKALFPELKRDVKWFDHLQSRLSNVNFRGTYERIAGREGKEISEIFRNAQVDAANEKITRGQAVIRLNKELRPYIQRLKLGGKPGLARWIETHVDAISDPDASFKGLAGFLKSFQYNTKLRLNPRSAFVNSLQPLQTLWPHLTTREYNKVWLDAFKKENRDRVIELAKHESGGGTENVNDEKRRLEWLDLFSPVSVHNRVVGHLAGELLADKKGLTGDAKNRMAADWAKKVEFDNSAYDIPPLFSGKIAGVVGQFKPFMVKNLERIYADWKSAPEEAIATNSWSGAGKIARRSKMVAAQVAIGGVRSAVPGIKMIGGVLLLGALAKGFGAFLDDDKAEKMAEAVYFGAPGLLDQDLSGSVMIFDEPFGQTTEEKIVNMLGPTISLAVKAWKEGGKIYNAEDTKNSTKAEKREAAALKLAKAVTPYTKSAQAIYAATQGKTPDVWLGKKEPMSIKETIGYGLMGTPLRQSKFYEHKEAADWQKKLMPDRFPAAAAESKKTRVTEAGEVETSTPKQRKGEPDAVYKQRKERVEKWMEDYGQKLIDHPRYKAMPTEDQKDAIENLRRRIGRQQNLQKPNMRSFEPGAVLLGVKKSAKERPKRQAKNLWNAPPR